MIHPTQTSSTPSSPRVLDHVSLTMFTVVKAFEGEADVHQRNALSSWKSLGDQVRIIVFYDQTPPADVLDQFECHQVEKVNPQGTPLLDDLFSRITLLSESPYYCFVNADILFDDRLLAALEKLSDDPLHSFLAIGRRIDVDVDRQLDSFEGEWLDRQAQHHSARPASIVCKDYFVFCQGSFENIPAFAVGRGNWDNWMVHHAKQRQIPVIDLSDMVPAIHQNHNYRHVDGGRMAAYVKGDEARDNQRLAEGRNLIRGSTANWKLTADGLRRLRSGGWGFWKDCPNFLKLMRNLLFLRD